MRVHSMRSYAFEHVGVYALCCDMRSCIVYFHDDNTLAYLL